MPESIIYKICSKCKQNQQSSSFDKRNNRKSGLQSQCKTCQRKQVKQIYFANPDKPRKPRKYAHIADFRIWRLKHSSIKLSAKRRNIEFNLTVENVITLYASITKPCSYCKQPIQRASVDRVNNRKGYHPANCILICSSCNILKNNATPEQIKEIYFQIFGNIKPSEITT